MGQCCKARRPYIRSSVGCKEQVGQVLGSARGCVNLNDVVTQTQF